MENNLNIYQVEQGSEAWHELRCGRLTASKFKDLMSKESTLGYKGLINNMVGQIISGEIEPSFKSDAMQRGNDLEPDASEEYEALYEVQLDEVGFITNPEIFPEYVGVSPDRLTPDGGLVEIKCPLMKTHITYLTDNKLPNEYKWQVQGQLLVTGAKYCDFMSYYPNIKPMILRVYPDVIMMDELKQRMEQSIERVKEKLKLIEEIKYIQP
jgi:putative phage-type endonuclease